MSSACTIVSPNQVSVGPGGCVVESTIALKLASVSAGAAPRLAAMSLDWSLVKLKPLASSFPKKLAGPILAVAVMCASTSRTDQPVHNDGVSQLASGNASRSAARASRSALIVGQMLVPAMLLRFGASSRSSLSPSSLPHASGVAKEFYG